MHHFPSTLQNNGANGLPRRSDSLNATQHKLGSHHIFLTIEEELHDARRVHSHGQEEDLRSALNMVINRVSVLSSLLSEAYKSQAELEVQLNVAKSNLQLVISNNEMLEEALKRDSSGNAKDVGWRRWSAREVETREQRASEERNAEHSPTASSVDSTIGSPVIPTQAQAAASPVSPAPQDTRFFRFRFNGSGSNPARPATRPATPSGPGPSGTHHLTSSSMPSLPPNINKELEDLNAELVKERAAHKAASDEKVALEAELESLSQALFEEANKMVATERIKRAETEEELKEARLEKEALQSALRLIEQEYNNLRIVPALETPYFSGNSHAVSSTPGHSRNSSEVGVKSAPSSPEASRARSLPSSTPPSPFQSDPQFDQLRSYYERSDDEQPTSQGHHSRPTSYLHITEHEPSPWADVRSTSPPQRQRPVKSDISPLATAALHSTR